jgi:hypothetical protein
MPLMRPALTRPMNRNVECPVFVKLDGPLRVESSLRNASLFMTFAVFMQWIADTCVTRQLINLAEPDLPPICYQDGALQG